MNDVKRGNAIITVFLEFQNNLVDFFQVRSFLWDSDAIPGHGVLLAHRPQFTVIVVACVVLQGSGIVNKGLDLPIYGTVLSRFIESLGGSKLKATIYFFL